MDLVHNYYLFEVARFCDSLRPFFQIVDEFERFADLSTDAIERFLRRDHIRELCEFNGGWTMEALLELRESSQSSAIPHYDPFITVMLYDALIGEATTTGGIPEPEADTRRQIQAAGWARNDMMRLLYGDPIENLCVLSEYLKPALDAYRIPCFKGSIGYLGELDVIQYLERLEADVEQGRLPLNNETDHILEAYRVAAEQNIGLCIIVCG